MLSLQGKKLVSRYDKPWHCLSTLGSYSNDGGDWANLSQVKGNGLELGKKLNSPLNWTESDCLHNVDPLIPSPKPLSFRLESMATLLKKDRSEFHPSVQTVDI